MPQPWVVRETNGALQRLVGRLRVARRPVAFEYVRERHPVGGVARHVGSWQ